MLHTISFLKLWVVLHRSDLFLKNIRKLIRASHLSFNVPMRVNTKQSGRAKEYCFNFTAFSTMCSSSWIEVGGELLAPQRSLLQ